MYQLGLITFKVISVIIALLKFYDFSKMRNA